MTNDTLVPKPALVAVVGRGADRAYVVTGVAVNDGGYHRPSLRMSIRRERGGTRWELHVLEDDRVRYFRTLRAARYGASRLVFGL